MSVKPLAQQVISRSSISNQASNSHRISQFEPGSKMSPQFELVSNQVLVDKALSSNPSGDAEARRQQVLTMLAEAPATTYAIATDTGTEPDAVILTLAIRDKATCELRILKARYDGLALLELIDKRTGPLSGARDDQARTRPVDAQTGLQSPRRACTTRGDGVMAERYANAGVDRVVARLSGALQPNV
jgi:hypothetical protein